MMSEKQLLLFMDPHVAPTLLYSKSEEEENQQPVVIGMHALQKFAAGGKNTLSAAEQLHISKRYSSSYLHNNKKTGYQTFYV